MSEDYSDVLENPAPWRKNQDARIIARELTRMVTGLDKDHPGIAAVCSVFM